jgi:hypothetical protein
VLAAGLFAKVLVIAVLAICVDSADAPFPDTPLETRSMTAMSAFLLSV